MRHPLAVKLTSLLAAVVAAGTIGIAFRPTTTAVTTGTNGGTIEAITPSRLLDTRTTNGGHNAALAAGETFDLAVLGRGAVPNVGVAAILINVTVVATGMAAGTNGYLTVWASGTTRPTASSINFVAGDVIANTALVPLGANGSISIYSSSFAAGEHVIVDVQGWVAAAMAEGAGPSIPFDQATLSAADSVKARQILNNAVKYAMGTWWGSDGQTLLVASLDQDANANDAVRRMSMQALGASTAVATGAYQPLLGEAYTPHIVAERVNTLLNRVASQHMVNHANGWGEGWQGPMWAALLGRAAWYIWDWPELTAQTKQYVAKVVEHEANWAARQKLHYLRDAAGTVLTTGDSGAEEVSWWAGAMQIALVMLPTNQNAAIWSKEIVQYALAAWARPADVTSSTVINGMALSSWISGSNVETDGVVINHNRVASDYSTTTYQNLDAAPLFVLSGQQIPAGITALLGPVYAAFRGATLTGGGHTYVEHTADIFYPDGNDWGIGQKLPYALSDAQALTYGFDPGTAAEYLGLHLDAQLSMQARFTDGRTYAAPIVPAALSEYNYVGREEHISQLASQLYLTLYMRDHGLVSFTNDPV
jgi:hypothetical protein